MIYFIIGGESGYALRFPRLAAFRKKDIYPENARTVEELIEMPRSQGGERKRNE
jgi:hypothetical protein